MSLYLQDWLPDDFSSVLTERKNTMIQCTFVGVDIAKLKFDAKIIHEAKDYHRVFENNLTGFKAFLSWIKKYAQSPWVCMEATGHYSEPLADFLYSQKIAISVVNPLQIKYFAKAKLNRNKNDKLDARVIGEYAEIMKPKLYKPRSLQQKEIREHVQLIDSLKKQCIQFKNQLESISSKGIKKEILSAITHIQKRTDKLEGKLKQLAQKDESFSRAIELLQSIKGVGFTTAISLLAYLPDISLFKTPKQLAAFMGVSPKQKESGQYKGKTCMSKFGNPRIRTVLYMPALVVKGKNPAFKLFIERLEKSGLRPKAIVGALMRKLVHIIFGMLKNNQPFDPALV